MLHETCAARQAHFRPLFSTPAHYIHRRPTGQRKAAEKARADNTLANRHVAIRRRRPPPPTGEQPRREKRDAKRQSRGATCVDRIDRDACAGRARASLQGPRFAPAMAARRHLWRRRIHGVPGEPIGSARTRDGQPSSERKRSRPISRVLSRAVIPLRCASPHTCSDLPGSSCGHT